MKSVTFSYLTTSPGSPRDVTVNIDTGDTIEEALSLALASGIDEPVLALSSDGRPIAFFSDGIKTTTTLGWVVDNVLHLANIDETTLLTTASAFTLAMRVRYTNWTKYGYSHHDGSRTVEYELGRNGPKWEDVVWFAANFGVLLCEENK